MTHANGQRTEQLRNDAVASLRQAFRYLDRDHLGCQFDIADGVYVLSKVGGEDEKIFLGFEDFETGKWFGLTLAVTLVPPRPFQAAGIHAVERSAPTDGESLVVDLPPGSGKSAEPPYEPFPEFIPDHH